MARFLRYGVVFLASVLFSVSVNAAKLTPITDPGTGAKIFVPSPDSLGQARTITVPVGVEPSGTARLPVTIKKNFPWPKVGASVKSILKTSPQAIIGTMAVSWLIDQIPDADIIDGESVRLQPGSPVPPSSSLDYAWRASYSSLRSTKYPDPVTACKALTGSVGSNAGSNARALYVGLQPQTSTSYGCLHQIQVYQDGQWIDSGQPTSYVGWNITAYREGSKCPSGSQLSSDGVCRSPSLVVPFSDTDYDQLIGYVPDIPADMWSEFGPALDSVPGSFDYPDSTDLSGPESISGNPTTTTTTDSTGNTTVSETTPSYNFDYSSNPLSVTSTTTTTTNNYTNGQHTSTTTTTTPSASSDVQSQDQSMTVDLEVPTDCDFMPTVCSFINWVKEPFNPTDDPDFSQFAEDKDFSESVTISGNATCPAPTIISTSKGSFEFSWEPACQWAGMIKPLVILFALIGAIYISLGIGRSD